VMGVAILYTSTLTLIRGGACAFLPAQLTEMVKATRGMDLHCRAPRDSKPPDGREASYFAARSLQGTGTVQAELRPIPNVSNESPEALNGSLEVDLGFRTPVVGVNRDETCVAIPLQRR